MERKSSHEWRKQRGCRNFPLTTLNYTCTNTHTCTHIFEKYIFPFSLDTWLTFKPQYFLIALTYGLKNATANVTTQFAIVGKPLNGHQSRLAKYLAKVWSVFDFRFNWLYRINSNIIKHQAKYKGLGGPIFTRFFHSLLFPFLSFTFSLSHVSL